MTIANSTHEESNHSSGAMQVVCRYCAKPGALERIMRVIRVRGFEMQAMSTRLEGDQFLMEAELMGQRAFENLVCQIEKLVDVQEVHLHVMEQPVLLSQCAN